MRLRNHDIEVEPIGSWPVEETLDRQYSRFKAPFSDTLDLLDRELFMLDAYSVVVQLDVDRKQIRLDGSLRASVTPRSPGVILNFESMHGPQSFPCDTFLNWKHNMRAIAKSLEALRTVNRYGVSKSGQQYRGWQSLPAPASYGFSSRESAWAYVSRLMNMNGTIPAGDDLARVLRDAARKTHPDHGGDAEEFKRVVRATEKLRE